MPTHLPQLIPDAGPEFAPSGASSTGLYAGEVWRYQLGEAARLVLPLPAWSPQPASCLRLAVFPEWSATSLDCCRLSLIAAGVDGSRTTLHDQHGHPQDGELRCLVADQWNLLDLNLDPVAGRQLGKVELVLPAGSGRGWLQVLGVHPRPGEPEDVVTRAVTTRGSHSGYRFSRGNTYPAVCLPHGFVFATPITDADTTRWIYRWASDGPLPRLQALALSHQPSPWLGERNSAQVMPWFGEPQRSPAGRALEFDHRTEQAHPHNYRVRLRTADTGHQVQAELTPTQHGAAFRFRFAGPSGPRGVLFDQLGTADLRFNPLPDGRLGLAWWLPAPAGGSAPSAWVYGETMQPVQPWRPERRRWRARPAAQVPALVLPAGEVLEVRLSQSFISLDQARHNYELQMRGSSFDQLTRVAHDAWSALLGRLELTGGTAEQRTAAWSGLARLFSWPNAHHENLGSNQAPRWAYASPYRRRSRPDDAERGGLPVVPGRLLVNNGYWDTYRTAWPAYHLLMPRHASELLDGILQAYRDSGWMSRWSAPGHHDLMVGTSSDVIFADAAAHGIGFDQRTGYDSALRNALQPSTDPAVGRRQLARARFVGWVDRSTRESVSWSMENANCDAALALWSGRLAGSDPARRPEYLANAAYFTNRALAWTALFDPRTGFIRGRDQGGFGTSFDPLAWGGDYTETNAWGMAFAPVWDGAGLASCLGGEDALAARLDQARATPETASRVGSYRAVIHEMVEARALRLGQLGVNNQPAHHIPYMYLHAGRPDATQALVAEICDRIFVGSEIGQGYPGDEDNGEMSAWQLFVMIGLYPLQVGSGQFVLSTPVFDKVVWHRDDGTTLRITASGAGRFIAAVRINGAPWHQVWVDVDTLHADCSIEVQRSRRAGDWGRQSRPTSLSRPRGGGLRHWQPDRTRQATIRPAAPTLVDDDGAMVQRLPAGMAIEFSWDEAFVPLCAAITFAEVPTDGGWWLEVHQPGSGWSSSGPTVQPQRPDQTTPQPLPSRPIDGLRLVAGQDVDLRQVEIF